jgi:hypothetical protein
MTDQPSLAPETSDAATAIEPIAKPKRRLARRIITWVLVVLFAILTPVTIASAWAVKTVTNTDRYVETLQPLAQDPVVTDYVAVKATDALFDQLNVQKRIATLIPVGGSVLAAPLTAQLETYTQAQMRTLLSSQWFQNLWEKENHFTHAAAVNLLTGKAAPATTKARKLVLNLTPALINAIDELDSKGVTIFNPIKKKLTADQALSLQLFSNKQVQTAQTFFNLAIELRIALLIGTPLIGVAAVLVAVERRRAALRVLLGGILGSLVLIVGLTVARSKFIAAVPADANLFSQHLWDTLTRFLHRSVNVVLGVFVLGAIVLWLTGPSTWAVAVRRTVRGSSKKVVSTAESAYRSEATSKAIEKATSALETSNAFVRRNVVPMRWVGVAVAGVFLLGERTTGSVFWTLVILAVYQVLISIPWVRNRPELESGDKPGAIEDPRDAALDGAQGAALSSTSGDTGDTKLSSS